MVDNTLTVRLAPKTQETLEELSSQKGLSPEEYVGRLLDMLLFEQWLDALHDRVGDGGQMGTNVREGTRLAEEGPDLLDAAADLGVDAPPTDGEPD